jgi:hypothetical protein
MPLLKVINLRRRNNDDQNDSVSIRGGHRKVIADERYPEVSGVRGEALEIVGTDVIEGRFINEKLMTSLTRAKESSLAALLTWGLPQGHIGFLGADEEIIFHLAAEEPPRPQDDLRLVPRRS